MDGPGLPTVPALSTANGTRDREAVLAPVRKPSTSAWPRHGSRIRARLLRDPAQCTARSAARPSLPGRWARHSCANGTFHRTADQVFGIEHLNEKDHGRAARHDLQIDAPFASARLVTATVTTGASTSILGAGARRTVPAWSYQCRTSSGESPRNWRSQGSEPLVRLTHQLCPRIDIDDVGDIVLNRVRRVELVGPGSAGQRDQHDSAQRGDPALGGLPTIATTGVAETARVNTSNAHEMPADCIINPVNPEYANGTINARAGMQRTAPNTGHRIRPAAQARRLLPATAGCKSRRAARWSAQSATAH